MKLGANGNVSWTKLIGGPNDRVMGLTVANDGAVYAVGSNAITGNSDGVVTKLSSSGVVQWTQTYASPGVDGAASITQGIDGNLYVAGLSNTGIDGQNYVAGNSGWNLWIGKLGTDGTKVWTKEYSPTAVGSGISQIMSGADGNLYLVGATSNQDLAGNTPQGATDATIAKIGLDGVVIWSKSFGDSNENSATDVAFYTTTTSTSTTTTSQVNVPALTVDISTQEGASSAITLIDSKIDAVSSTRSTIGSYINRLNYAADNATNISTNIAASRSAIQDTDYAEESANLAKSQITQQAATAMLAQANQQPQSVLALLKNL